MAGCFIFTMLSLMTWSCSAHPLFGSVKWIIKRRFLVSAPLRKPGEWISPHTFSHNQQIHHLNKLVFPLAVLLRTSQSLIYRKVRVCVCERCAMGGSHTVDDGSRLNQPHKMPICSQRYTLQEMKHNAPGGITIPLPISHVYRLYVSQGH